MENQNKQRFMFCSKIIMLIILSIEFIFNICYISIIIDIKSKLIGYFDFGKSDFVFIYKKHYSGISAAFSLFIIFFVVFIITFIINCKFDTLIEKVYQYLIIFTAFILCQILYLTECMIIPVYLARSKFENKLDENDKAKSKYTTLTVLCIISLPVIIFMNFIVLNLFKKICCNMVEICDETRNCCDNFGRWIIDKITCLCNKKVKDKNVAKSEQKKDKLDIEIMNLTGDISNLLAQNIEITLNKLKI